MKKAIPLLMVSLLILSCNNMSRPDVPSQDEIVLDWEFTGNNASASHYSSVFTLENRSKHILRNSGWELYFSQMGGGFIQQSVTGPVRIEHVNGDLSRITPMEDFMLEPGQIVEIGFNKRGSLMKKNEAPMGPYMVYDDKDGAELAVHAISEYTVKPYPPLEAIFPSMTSVPLPHAGWVYEQNLHQVLLNAENTGKIIPSPLKMQQGNGKVMLEDGIMIHYSEGCDREAEYLSKMLHHCMGAVPAIMQSLAGGPNIIRLVTGEGTKSMGPEEYMLTADAGNGIVISGGDPAGVYYGVQSFLSLLPVEAWAQPMKKIEIEAINLHDKPAFGYRGMHLDIARNFIEPADIRKLIQVMAFYKLNKLHLHLTDDEAWRLEIPGFPELTEIGGFRGSTRDSKDHLPPAYGSGPVPERGVGHGSGFLSRETFIEILQFAHQHHVEVIPEVNFPGHARAAIYAMEARYDRLMEEGKEDEALQFRLIDPDDQSRYNSAQDYNDNVICVCQEAPYLFYETVVDEIMMMYEAAGLKLRVMHAGGDEVPRGSWTASPVCNRFLEDHPEIGGAENLQAYFEEQLFEILSKKNLVMAGWEEIAMKKNEQGEWIPNPELVGAKLLPYVWNSQDDYLDLGNRLANAGYPVILCNVTNYYFDLAYNHHPLEPGHYWGGFVNTRRAFEFVPYDVFKSTLTDKYWKAIDIEDAIKGMEPLKAESRKNIVGIQGQLWTEFVKGGEMMEYLLLPKMIGLAERAWAGQQGWGEIPDVDQRIKAMNQAWNEFANVLGQREMPRLDYIFGGFNYRLPPPGAKIIGGMLYANIDFPGLTIRYTTDGSDPEMDSPIYSDPAKVTGIVKLRAFDSRGKGSRISVVDVR